MTTEFEHLKKIFFEGMRVKEPLDGEGVVVSSCANTGTVTVKYPPKRIVNYYEGYSLTAGSDQEHNIFLSGTEGMPEVEQVDWLERSGFKTIRARGFFAGRHVRNYVITCPAVMELQTALDLTAKRQSEYIGHEIVIHHP